MGIIRQGFGGDIETGLRSPQIRELLELFAMATNQPRTGSLAPRAVPTLFSQRGGVLSSAPIVDNGLVVGASRVVTNTIQAAQEGFEAKLEMARTAAIEGFQARAESVHAKAIAEMGSITSSIDPVRTAAPGPSGLLKRKIPFPIAASFTHLLPRLGLPNLLASAPQTVQAAPAQSQPITVIVQNQLPAESVGNYMRGEVVETISHTSAGHQAVSSASMSATRASVNRRQLTALQVAPGVVTG